MAIKLTESRLRQIIREEARLLTRNRRTLREGAFSYRAKLDLVEDAIDSLRKALDLESQSDIGEDPDLESLIDALEGYASAVRVMAADEDVPADPFITLRDPRAMRH